jgi:surface polysaccharide O-acyltransferase-like enzyme
MALNSRVFDDLLHFTSASRSKTAVILAAVSFAVCHLVVMGTSSPAASADLDAEIPRQIIYFAAELCRFALPLGFMVAGFAIRAKKSPPSPPKK